MDETLKLDDEREARALLGRHDQLLRRLRDGLNVQAWARGTEIHISGDAEETRNAMNVLHTLKTVLTESGRITDSDVDTAMIGLGGAEERFIQETITVLAHGRHVRPRTDGQLCYVRVMASHDLVFCTGPAGTGKTYLAVAMATNYLKDRRVKKICLVRPAVEAGEKLGFLPGDIVAKVNPYLRPVYDALNDMIEFGHLKKYMDNDMIEVVPLAYMRGRTLNDAFIILDEAQNTTIGQMKMFLTRLGMRSKFVVTGDVSQIDLPGGETSGLVDAQRLLRDVDDIALVALTSRDIVRHPIVQKVVDAYDARDARKRRARASDDSDKVSGG